MGQKQVIKNIFWDVDGVLANLNYAYFNFLTKHPKYRTDFGHIKWEDLPEVLPILPKYGALELKTHPVKGVEMDRDFCQSWEFFANRPLYPDAIEVLRELNQRGYCQFTMSATFDVATKKKLLNQLLSEVTDFLTIECVQHGKFMHDSAKEDMLKFCLDKYGLKADETLLVDDRIYNIEAAEKVGVHPLRMRCEFTLPLPIELQDVTEVHNMTEARDWLVNNTVSD